jgi:hypothetical protein
MIYVILRPEHDTPLGYVSCAAEPSLELLADSLAWSYGFVDRDALLHLNPGLHLGFAPLH